MTLRRNIKIVAGSNPEDSLLSIWEKVAARHAVEILALDASGQDFKSSLPVTIFPQVPEMTGYYRDLDRYLSGADLIVGVEGSRLYSFQALRAARRQGVPFICISHESVPFAYEGYKNIRAIQHDIFKNSDIIIASSRRACQLLRIEGVSDERVRRIQAVTDSAKYSFSLDRSIKFRKYIGVSDTDIIMTIISNLEDADPVQTLLRGLRLGLNQVSSVTRKRVRLLICGHGQAAAQLKYQVSDMGFGHQAIFICQDAMPFLQDLLCASDYLLEGRFFRSGTPELLPWHVLSASTCGTKILTSPGSLADDWLSGQMITRFEDFAPLEIGVSVAEVLNMHIDDSSARFARADLAGRALSPDSGARVISELVGQLCIQDTVAGRRQNLSEFVRRHQIPVNYKDAADVLVACEESVEFSASCEISIQSEVLRIRGDALAALARGDEALSSFEESLRVNGQNFQALRGLGYLAWNGHSHEEALRFFQRALAVNPNDYQCLVGVGLVYRRLKMFDESVFWLQKAISVGGLESSSLGLLVQACLENSQAPEALDVLTSIRDTLGEHPALATAISKLESHS